MAILRAQSSVGAVLSIVFADFLAYVDGKTPQPTKVFGPKDSEAAMSPPGVWWAMGPESWSAPQRQGMPGNPGALWVREIPLTIMVFGGENADEPLTETPSTHLRDADVTEWMVEALVNSFHKQLSQHSYQVEGATWGEGARDAIGLACELDVTLRLPLVRLDNPIVTVTGITTSVEIDADGT